MKKYNNAPVTNQALSQALCCLRDQLGNGEWIPYTLSIYDAGDDAMVFASGGGVTFSKLAGTGTFTIPDGVFLFSATITGETADLATNNFIIDVTSAGGTHNDNVATMFAPTVQVANITTVDAGGPTTGLPFVYDIDNDPQKQIVDLGGGSISVRVINLNVYTKWAIIVNF